MAHNSHKELSKFKCLCLTCHTDTACSDFKHAGSDTVIKCINSAKLLGVKVDHELHWRNHVQHAIKKGMDLLATVNRLTQLSFGLPTPNARRLFTVVVVPKVEYALPVWYTPVCTQHAQTGTQARSNTPGR